MLDRELQPRMAVLGSFLAHAQFTGKAIHDPLSTRSDGQTAKDRAHRCCRLHAESEVHASDG